MTVDIDRATSAAGNDFKFVLELQRGVFERLFVL